VPYQLGHMTRRFFGSLRPGGPAASEVEWVAGQLLPGELELWSAMPGPDRRHSAGVARRVEAMLGPAASRPVLAAALLHDVGKTGGLRTLGRTGSTIAAMVFGRARVAARGGRVGRYLEHDRHGADMLERVGSDPLFFF